MARVQATSLRNAVMAVVILLICLYQLASLEDVLVRRIRGESGTADVDSTAEREQTANSQGPFASGNGDIQQGDDHRGKLSGHGENMVREAMVNDANTEDLLTGSGFKGTHLFHVTANGTLVEGVIFVKSPTIEHFPFAQNAPDWEGDRETAEKTFKFKNGRCYWCPRSPGFDEPTDECHFGTFHAGWYKDDHLGRPPLKTYKKDALFRVRSFTSTHEALKSKRDFTSTYFRCAMTGPSIPFGVEGVLRVENLSQMVFYVNPGKVPVLHKESSVVCFRSMFGAGVSVHAVIQVIGYYLNALNVTRVVMQESGLLRGLLVKDLVRHPSIRKWLQEERFMIVDLRDSFNRLYGPIGTDISQFTGHHGQIHNIGDCVIRAKVDGFEWAIVIDRDELIFPGPRTIRNHGRIETWAEIVRRKEQEAQDMDGRELHVITIASQRVNETLICDQCDGFEPNTLLSWVRENEFNTTLQASGAKSAIRLNPFTSHPLVNGVGIHTIAKSGIFPGISTPAVTLKPSIDDLNIRHYYCLNWGPKQCDTFPLAYAPMDDWAVPPSQ